jgi:hypothetical protein
MGCNAFTFTAVYWQVHSIAELPAAYTATAQEVYNLVDNNQNNTQNVVPCPRPLPNEDAFASNLK